MLEIEYLRRLAAALIVSLVMAGLAGCAAAGAGDSVPQEKLAAAQAATQKAIDTLSLRAAYLAAKYGDGPSDAQSIGDAVVAGCQPYIDRVVSCEVGEFYAQVGNDGISQDYVINHKLQWRHDAEVSVHRIAVAAVVKFRSSRHDGSGVEHQISPRTTSRPSSYSNTSESR